MWLIIKRRTTKNIGQWFGKKLVEVNYETEQ